MNHPAAGASSAGHQSGHNKRIPVYDCRCETVSRKILETRGLDYNGFLQLLCKAFNIYKNETYVLVTTDRTVVDYLNYEELQDGSTVHLLFHPCQPLPAATEENIMFTPHYDTLIKSGTHEYYAEGQKALPYALAELLDNSISATTKNDGSRSIEIRLLFDKSRGKHAVLVLDNGCGMTSKQLNNWAVYRLSKFTRENSAFSSMKEGYVRPDYAPRFLNSDLSYFGVGGKQAAFFIGDSVQMISKPQSSPDVHELVLSKEEFERKEKNKEDVYTGTILNRKPCDATHVRKEEHFLCDVIAEESGKKSFTIVVITGLTVDHINYLKNDFEGWTRELAHIYHYYIHGVDPNVLNSAESGSRTNISKIDILVTLREKPPKSPRLINLKDVDNDMQSLYINAAVDTFEFHVSTNQDGGKVEGLLRYHPFLYDKETYPKDPCAPQAALNDEDDEFEGEGGTLNKARGKKDIFECYWNGRLIPYTTVSEFDWCSRPSKSSTLPAECYNRLSGVLFTNDKFTVSTNKLKFMELELKLKNKYAIFTPINRDQQKHSKRGNITKEFLHWLENCHAMFDKQVKFCGFKEKIERTDVPVRMKYPWAAFTGIERDGKILKAGQLIKSQKTQPILYGKVVQFLLYGNYSEDEFATGGEVEINREPKALYDRTKIIPISKIDLTASEEQIQKAIDSDSDKLPEKLALSWPEENPWSDGAKVARIPAGTPLGPLEVNIMNRKGDTLSKMPVGGPGGGIKLSVRLKVTRQVPKKDEEIISLVAPYIQNRGYWFKKIESLKSLGKYTLALNTIINETGETTHGARQLPSISLNFVITAGKPDNFTICPISQTHAVGAPFNIILQINDVYGHPTTLPPNIQPLLHSSEMKVTYESVSSDSNKLIIKGVKALGTGIIRTKSYDLQVTLPDLRLDTQTVKIGLYPGRAHSLHVEPDGAQVKLENGSAALFNVEIHDEAGNITINARQVVRCQVEGYPVFSTDMSKTGVGQIVTKPIKLEITNGKPQIRTVQFDVHMHKHIPRVEVELKIIPSSQVASIKVYCKNPDHLQLKENEQIQWQAGGLLENLFYKLFDESGIEVPLTDDIASKVKVNWASDADCAGLAPGKLPNIKVPAQLLESRYCQVSYQDQSLSFDFTVTPCPNEPSRLKVTLPQTFVGLGEFLVGSINLDLVDQYGNKTNRLTPACVKGVTMEAEGLDQSNITVAWQPSSNSIVVSGVCFTCGPLGSREVCFTCSDFVEHVEIKVTAGEPAEFKLFSGPEEPLQVLNGHGIPTPFLLQLCDKWGNFSRDKRVTAQISSSSPLLKLTTPVASRPVDNDGKASFTVTAVNAVMGCYQLNFGGLIYGKPLKGPSIVLTVIPDCNKPVRLSVDYDPTAVFSAGGTFPVFSVSVISDEGRPIPNINPANLSMMLWKGESPTSPGNAVVLRCSKPRENERSDCCYFRDKEIPEQAGPYVIQFKLQSDRGQVSLDHQIKITVVADLPVKLGTTSPLGPRFVSNSGSEASRTLVEDMTLVVMDKFGNPAGWNMNGKVEVSIQCPDIGGARNLPLFEGEDKKSITVMLEKGKAHISRLLILKMSPGENGSTYDLLFQPDIPMHPAPLVPLKVPFHFSNDVEKQHRMSELTRKRDNLKEVIGLFERNNTRSLELLELLQKQVSDVRSKEESVRRELNSKGIKLNCPLPLVEIEKLIREKTTKAEHFRKIPRRVCSISNNFTSSDVLGMVGHLAAIEDDKAARVISWQLRGDMDCVITRTTEAARTIYQNTRGMQQVLPMDCISKQAADRPLPHIRNGRSLFDPPGNPVYARHLLIFQSEKESCDIVFKNILRDTILMDNLDSATSYRREVVRNGTYCPTILTRDGNRVSSNGKFGGLQNVAPPMEKLQVFGAPLPQQYFMLQEETEMLRQYMTVIEKKEKAEGELESFLKESRSPERLHKQQLVEEKKKEFLEIERELSSLQPAKRGAEQSTESWHMTKRQRTPSHDF